MDVFCGVVGVISRAAGAARSCPINESIWSHGDCRFMVIRFAPLGSWFSRVRLPAGGDANDGVEGGLGLIVAVEQQRAALGTP